MPKQDDQSLPGSEMRSTADYLAYEDALRDRKSRSSRATQSDSPEMLPAVVALARVLNELSIKVTGKGFTVVIAEPDQQVLFDSRSCPSGYVTFHAEGDAPPAVFGGD